MGNYNNAFSIDEEEKKKINVILEAKNYYKEQKFAVEKAKYLLNVLENNYVSAIRSCITRYDLIPAYIDEAIKELNQKDKRKAKHNLEFLEHCISEDFFDNKVQIKIIDIITYGLSTTGIEFYFVYNDKTYWIYTPLRHNISTLESDLLEGKFGIFVQDNESSSSILFSSYDVNEMKKWICSNIVQEESQTIPVSGLFTKGELINGYENKEETAKSLFGILPEEDK